MYTMCGPFFACLNTPLLNYRPTTTWTTLERS